MKAYLATVAVSILCGCAMFNKPDIASREWWASRSVDDRFQLIRR